MAARRRPYRSALCGETRGCKRTAATGSRRYQRMNGQYTGRIKGLGKIGIHVGYLLWKTIECWDILRHDIDSIIEQFVPLKTKQEKQSQKKLFEKIAYKQIMWRIYRRTRKDEEYANYKETLTATTTEKM